MFYNGLDFGCSKNIQAIGRKIKPKVAIYQTRGWYQVRIPYTEGNKRYLIRALHTKDRAEAELRARELEFECEYHKRNGLSLFPKTFAEVCDEWFESTDLSEHMVRLCEKALMYWKEYLKGRKLNDIEDTIGYLSYRRNYWKTPKKNGLKRMATTKDNPADKTIVKELQTARRVFEFALRKGYITKLPEIPKLKKIKNNRRPDLTLQEQHRFRHQLNTLVNEKPDDHHRQMFRALMLTLLYSGIRLNEARQLRWKDVELVTDNEGRETYVLHVTKSKTKAYEAVCRVTARPIIDKYREFLDNTGFIKHESQLVFCEANGVAFGDLRELFHSVCKKAGIANDVVPYSLRHTYATNYLKYNKQPDVYRLSEQMGTSIEMIQNYYGHTTTRDRIENFT
jgi:integrase